MNAIKYLKTKGIKRALQVLWDYKLDNFLTKGMALALKKAPLKNIIIIESHNDFDCNGGAFYDYLLSHDYNLKYKIVWALRKPPKEKLPRNVEWIPLQGPSIKKSYYVSRAKFFTSDCETIKKVRSEQKSFFLTHGAGGLKNVIGKVIIPSSVDYVLIQSMQYAPIQAKQYSLEYPSDRIISIGYPVHDLLIGNNVNEIQKITKINFKKVILWMPTFRVGGGFQRNDSLKEQPLGIPLISDFSQYTELNAYLNKRDTLLIIKIHPKQDLTTLGIKNLSNVIVLTGEDVKKKNVDNYRLMNCVDAVISDYSGVAYEFLQLNRPIAYVLDDMNEYRLGFVVADIRTLLAGAEIYSMTDMYSFIDSVIAEKDPYKEKREQIRNYIYEYHDTNNCKRLAEFMGL